MTASPQDRSGPLEPVPAEPASDAHRRPAPEERGRADLARKHLRGASLLLSGRSLSIGVKFAVQVLVVRYLSTSEYGAWAYALAVVALLGGFAHLSLDRAVVRFTAIYHEKEQYDKFFGAILLVIGAVAATGLLFVAGLYAFPEALGRLIGGEEQPLALMMVMVFLVPLEALDTLLIGIFATLGRPRAIFFRRYVLAPLVQLAVVGLLILRKADVIFLAYGYLAGTLLGVVISTWVLFHTLHRNGFLERFRLRGITVPARELFAFSVPLMTTDWLAALVQSSGALVLGYFHDTEQVALFRVVAPVAALNHLVLKSFTTLYEPTASRLFAQSDLEGINDLYWRTAVWIAVLSFPIFAVTFATATPLTVLLFGARYEAAGTILAVLAMGQYIHASLGFNGNTIKVVGKIRYVMVINLLAAVINLALTLLLVSPLGARGAAVAMAATTVVHNVLKQIGLKRATGSSMFDSKYVSSYVVIATGMAGLVAARHFASGSPALLAALAVAISLLVLVHTRKTLRIAEVFPEVVRIPLLRGLLK